MSVAFRRESDEEHKEPRFELPLPPGPNLVTERGLALTHARVAEIEASLTGELTEEAKADLQRQLRYWRTRAATAVVAPMPSCDNVAFGTRVELSLNGKQRSIDIVGDDEAEPDAGRIAFSAPLARAIMGGEVEDLVDFGGRAEAIEIIGIMPITD